MRWFSVCALYILFWTVAAFVVLPFGVRTHEEAGMPLVPGQADSAPAGFRPLIVVARITLLASAAFAIFYLNYLYGWVPVSVLDVFGGGPAGYHDPAYLASGAASGA